MNICSPPAVIRQTAALLFAIAVQSVCAAAPGGAYESAVTELQQGWDVANYDTQGKARAEALARLVKRAEAVTTQYPDRAEGWIWSGIIRSTYAGAKSGLGALSQARAARRDLEKAIELNPVAMQGSAYTSLGTLYYKVPGWPLGFGSRDKAASYLRRAREIDPDGIDSNYFYGEFLYEQGDAEAALAHLQRAQQAAPRLDREIADRGRQAEIRTLLARISAE